MSDLYTTAMEKPTFMYSENIALFVGEIKRTIKSILSNEVRLKVRQDRFYDRKEKYTYPIQVVIYNNKSMLGYFDSNFYELGFHECLMYTSKEDLHNVIRHELAHYLTFIEHGEAIKSHGTEFRTTCQDLGWNEEVYRATTTLKESIVFRKIQKLMALATSSNPHEAEQAMIKSRELLLKHNIDSNYIGETGEKIFLKRIMKQKRENAKMRAIAKILETFFVSTVYTRAGGYTYLEILGRSVNVEIAEYVAETLMRELEHLWNLTSLKGALAKNSFFLGLAKGYVSKVHTLHIEHMSALMVIEKNLAEAKAMAYPHLSHIKNHSRFCSISSKLGEQMGRELKINLALSSHKSEGKLLTCPEKINT